MAGTKHQCGMSRFRNHSDGEGHGIDVAKDLLEALGEYPGRADRSDLRYRVEVSEDLISWSEPDEPVNWHAIEPDFAGVPRMRVFDPTLASASQRRFMRIAIEWIHE